MNSLSWFLYFADVLTNLQPVLAIPAVAAAISGGIAIFVFFMTNDKHDEIERKAAKKAAQLLWSVAIICGLSACLIPSRTTIYMMAGSELAEIVVTDPVNIDVMKDVRTLIQKQLKEALDDTHH